MSIQSNPQTTNSPWNSALIIIITKWDRSNEGKRKNVGNCSYICLDYIEFVVVDTAK